MLGMLPGRALTRSWVEANTRRVRRRVGPKPYAPRVGGRIDGAVTSVRVWAAETPGATYEPVKPAESYVRRVPKTLTPVRQARLERVRPHESPEAFRATLPQARLAGFHAPIVLTSDQRLLAESAFEHVRESPPSGRRLHRARRLNGRYMALLNQWWENHFHWVVDTLPRASLLPLEEEPDTPIIVPARLTSTQLESLAMIGIQEERLVRFDHLHLQVDQLVFPSFAGQPGYPPPWAVDWVRDRLSPQAAPASRRIWISRAAAARGRVTNERAVMDMLEGYGFEFVQPERHSLAEQLRMFAAADVIVAPHGSGLANLVAARDATVIELQSERWWGKGCYFALSDALGLDYWYLLCEASRWEHLAVDVSLLEATLEAALDTRA